MATDTSNSPDRENNPTNQGDARFGAETLLSPEQMAVLANELLTGIEEQFPQIGEIPAQMDPENEGFQFGKLAKYIWTPGIGARPLYDSTERTGKDDPRPKDFATWFMQTFGKTVTVRVRTSNELPEPKDLQHKKVPRIVRGLLDTSKGDEDKSMLKAELVEVISHNVGLAEGSAETDLVIAAHYWMIDRLNARIAQGGTA